LRRRLRRRFPPSTAGISGDYARNWLGLPRQLNKEAGVPCFFIFKKGGGRVFLGGLFSFWGLGQK